MDEKFLKSLEDKVWFTYAARIQTHKRLNFNNFWSNFILVCYSLATLIASVVSLKAPQFYGCNTNELIVIISAITLIASLMIVNVNYQTRALRMRDNYISLQNLYENIKNYLAKKPQDDSEISCKYDFFIRKYMEILEKNENHTTIDDIANRCQANGLSSREPSCYERFLLHLYKSFKWVLILLLLSLPFYLMMYPLFKFLLGT